MAVISLRGVRTHNLKAIDVEIPLGRLTVVTGVAGAGKSSLVFDTLYAEAQRRYLQSFSVYTRQFLDRFEKPDAESIGDLPPAIAIRRAPSRTSLRSTVGTLTETADLARLLFARIGTLYCLECNLPVLAQCAADVLAEMEAMPAGTRATIAFPHAPTGPEDVASWTTMLREEGYVRVKIGAALHRLDEPTLPTIVPGETIWVLLDRVEIGKTPRERLTESIDAAFRRGQGRLAILTDAAEAIFDERHVCPRCRRVYPSPEPRLFDPEDPHGACPTCQGTGVVNKGTETCSTCGGRRLNSTALAVKIDGDSIADWFTEPCRSLADRMNRLTPPDPQARLLTASLHGRLNELAALDLGYLTLAQSAPTLSDGVVRRIGIANALASSLVHVLYVLDEPTVGIHPSDIDKLVAALHRLRDRGNTLVVVEHQRAILEAADHVIDIGPEAGDEGGTVVYQGAPSGLDTSPESPTSDFWTGRDFIETPTRRRKPTGYLKLAGTHAKNLRDLAVAFPLGVLCVVTGVAGAGKRSLVIDTLYPAVCRARKKKAAATTATVTGAQAIADIILLDQEPLPRGARSNPATYLKVFDDIRALFAETIDARIRNFGPGHFSFNQPGGRCETCSGEGSLTIDMQFLADVTTTCPECHGRRFRKEILDIKVRSRSIAEVLDLTIREAFRFFRAQPAIEKKLKSLLDVGLDYLRLGQSVETLAGGEVQRLKLAAHLASSRKIGCLFVLIEPSNGLHPADAANLLACFDRLLSAGHSLIVIENHLDVIKCADWIIDLGGGTIVGQGTPEDFAEVTESRTGMELRRVVAERQAREA